MQIADKWTLAYKPFFFFFFFLLMSEMINISFTVYIHTFDLHMLLFTLFFYVYWDEIKKSE